MSRLFHKLRRTLCLSPGTGFLNRPSLWIIDNEAARYSMIKGASLSLSMLLLIREIAMIDAEQSTGAWYERVLSACNIANLPSKGNYM